MLSVSLLSKISQVPFADKSLTNILYVIAIF